MFNRIISWSLGHKITVLILAGIVTVFGLWSIATMKVDILPDINKPTVTIFTESDGMAAEEVERQTGWQTILDNFKKCVEEERV